MHLIVNGDVPKFTVVSRLKFVHLYIYVGVKWPKGENYSESSHTISQVHTLLHSYANYSLCLYIVICITSV